MVGIPAPSFDTHRVTEILRRLKRHQITSKKGVPYRRVYLRGELNTINTCASRELGAGGYTLKHFHEDWYYLGLKEVPVKSGRGWKKGAARKGASQENEEQPLAILPLLNRHWTTQQGDENEYESDGQAQL